MRWIDTRALRAVLAILLENRDIWIHFATYMNRIRREPFSLAPAHMFEYPYFSYLSKFTERSTDCLHVSRIQGPHLKSQYVFARYLREWLSSSSSHGHVVVCDSFSFVLAPPRRLSSCIPIRGFLALQPSFRRRCGSSSR